MSETDIVKVEVSEALSSRDVQARVNLMQEVMTKVMEDGVHFGKIPGCPKPSLFKAGAEKLAATFQISVQSEVEDLSTSDEKRYRVTCSAFSTKGIKLGSAVGECSSNEEKYRWQKPVCSQEYDETPADRRREKWAVKKEWVKGRFEKVYKDGVLQYEKIKQIRTEHFDLANTILQMADKRAYVAVIRKVTAASDIFTQDIEDLDVEVSEDQSSVPAKESIPLPKPITEKPATQNSAEPPPDMIEMQSKYNSFCKGCNNPIQAGEKIFFAKGVGGFHPKCKGKVSK